MKREREISLIGTPIGEISFTSPQEKLNAEVKEFQQTAVARYNTILKQLDKNENLLTESLLTTLEIPLHERFKRIIKIGQGKFGEVYIVYDNLSKTHLTMKRTQLLHGSGKRIMGVCNTTARELHLLRMLNHINIVPLLDYHVVPDGTFIMLMPVIPYDLVSLIRLWRKGGPRGEPSAGRMPLPTIKCIFRQLLSGLSYLHRERIIHRDLKPSNIMIDEKGIVKIIDFGWARFCPARWRGSMTGPPCPVCYRPPEILLGGDFATNYDASIDLWCAGCILYEMLSGGKMFVNASNELDAVAAIIDWLGSPSPRSTLYYGKSKKSLVSFKQDRPNRLVRRCELMQIDKESIDMLSQMLQLEPRRRHSAEELLQHAWFTSAPAACEPTEISLPAHNTYRWLESRHSS